MILKTLHRTQQNILISERRSIHSNAINNVFLTSSVNVKGDLFSHFKDQTSEWIKKNSEISHYIIYFSKFVTCIFTFEDSQNLGERSNNPSNLTLVGNFIFLASFRRPNKWLCKDSYHELVVHYCPVFPFYIL